MILLTPKQISFETEYFFLEFLGEYNYKNLKILNFEKMFDFIYKNIDDILFLENYKKNQIINSLQRNILVNEVINKLKKNNDSLQNVDNLKLFCRLIKNYKENNFNYVKIKNKIKKIKDETLKDKLKISADLIYEYEKLLKKNFSDPLDELTFLYKILKNNAFFNKFTIFVDEFSYFTVCQLNILKLMIKETQVFITFKCDADPDFLVGTKRNNSNEINKFEESLNWQCVTKNTIKKIMFIAKNLGFEKKIVKKELDFEQNNSKNKKEINILSLKQNFRAKNLELKILEKNLFKTNLNMEFFEVFSDFDHNNISLYKASDILDECEFVARNIKKLVMEENYKYEDIAVISRNIEDYKDYIKNTFDDYDIPYFLDYPETIIYKNLIIFVISAIEVVNSNFKSKEIFKFLKIGLTDIEQEEISIIEDYCVRFNIDNEDWLQDFCFFTQKNAYKKLDEEEKNKKLNEIRIKIISPFLNFKEQIDKNIKKNMVKLFFDFLMDINLPQNIKKKYNFFFKKNKLRFAEEQVRLWDILVNFLEIIDDLFKDSKISLKELSENLLILAKTEKISFIPQENEVFITSVERMCIKERKAVFIIGVSKGNFPKIEVNNGFFNVYEIKKLTENNIKIENTIEELWTQELFYVYSALTISKEKIFISWFNSNINDGNSSVQNEIILWIQKIFPNIEIKCYENLNILDALWSKKSALIFYMKKINSIDNNYESKIINFLKKYFENDVEIRKKINTINTNKNDENFKTLDDKKMSTFLENKILISPSQIENFYKCKLMYFFRYILKIKKINKLKFNNTEYGSMIHFLLEKFFNNLSQKNNSFEKIEIINNFINEYVSFVFDGFEKKNNRFKYNILRQTKFVDFLINRIQNKIDKNNVVSSFFEFEIFIDRLFPKDENDSNDFKISLQGKIDRIDIMKSNFFKIIDFKTGNKKFELSNIIYGIEIQLIIYLKIISQYSKYKNIINSKFDSFFYFPTTLPVINIDNKLNFLKNSKEINTKIKLQGITLEKNYENKEEYKDDNLEIVNKNELNTIFEFTDFLIKNMIDSVKLGDFSPNPICINNRNICDYCDFNVICKRNKKTINKIKKQSKDEILKKMSEIIALFPHK